MSSSPNESAEAAARTNDPLDERIAAIVAKYRSGHVDDAQALAAAAHDILVILDILHGAGRAASAGLDRGFLRRTVAELHETFELTPLD